MLKHIIKNLQVNYKTLINIFKNVCHVVKHIKENRSIKIFPNLAVTLFGQDILGTSLSGSLIFLIYIIFTAFAPYVSIRYKINKEKKYKRSSFIPNLHFR